MCTGLPVGIGSHVSWDRKLDGRIGQAMMSIPAVKALGVGSRFEAAKLPGSAVHDEIISSGERRGPRICGGVRIAPAVSKENDHG